MDTERFHVTLAEERHKHIYIAGPMTGLPGYNFDAFNETAERLRAEGWVVHNPADHGLVEGALKNDYLRYDVRELMLCEAIYMLPGWRWSTGACFEHDLAIKFEMQVQFHPDAERYQPVPPRPAAKET